MKITIFIFVSALIFASLVSPWAIAAKETIAKETISDNRVENLSCKSLSRDSVALAFRRDVYDVKNHLPYRNWSFRYGFYDLANCWSLSRLQRVYLFLREPGAQISAASFSNQARGADMEYIEGQGWRSHEFKKFRLMPEQSESQWKKWEQGWVEKASSYGQELERGLREDIESYQVDRFHSLSNLKYLGGPLGRTPADNLKSMKAINALLKKGRTPMVILRPDTYNQHVVLIKRAETTPVGYRYWVYDSNAPYTERSFEFTKSTSMFTAYDIVVGFPIPDARAAVGLFVVDTDENETLLRTLVAHYKKLCAAP